MTDQHAIQTALPFSLELPTWANGPAGTGNGGWTSGALASRLASAGGAVVDLRVPPPLGRELQVRSDDEVDGAIVLLDDVTVVARARSQPVRFHVPDAVRAISPEQAETASAGFPYRAEHPFPTCVCCGVSRASDQPSLEIHCGPVDGITAPDTAGSHSPIFADIWVPDTDIADPDDAALASVEACWCALDCPSAAPFAASGERSAVVLARFAVELTSRARIGEQHVLAAWQRSIDGRKCQSVSVLLDAHGTPIGRAEALWIEVRT